MRLHTPTFTTKRLNVFRVDLRPTEDNHERKVFLGFLRHEDWPAVAVTATTGPNAFDDGIEWLEMIETSATRRREGLARELWRGIEKYLGRRLYGDGVTEAGAALIQALRREYRKPVGKPYGRRRWLALSKSRLAGEARPSGRKRRLPRAGAAP